MISQISIRTLHFSIDADIAACLRVCPRAYKQLVKTSIKHRIVETQICLQLQSMRYRQGGSTQKRGPAIFRIS